MTSKAVHPRLSGKPSLTRVAGHSYWKQHYIDLTGKRRAISSHSLEFVVAEARFIVDELTSKSDLSDIENRAGAESDRTSRHASIGNCVRPRRCGASSDPSLTFWDLAETYIADSRVGRNGNEPLEASTLKTYMGHLRNWIVPEIGNLPVEMISKKDVLRLHSALRAKCPSSVTAKRCFALTKAILNYAVMLEIRDSNPTMGISVREDHRTRKSRIRDLVPTHEEMRKIERAALDGYNSRNLQIRKTYQRYYPAFLVLRHCGLRSSELFGLQWQDLNVKERTISINRKIAKPDSEVSEEDRIGQPKTAHSLRTLPVPDSLIVALENWRRQCPRSQYDWMFPTKSGKPLSYFNFRRDFWVPCLKRAGVRHYKMHSLRHYYASQLLRQDLIKAASVYLGHSTVAFTMDYYAHLIPDDLEQQERVRAAIVEGS